MREIKINSISISALFVVMFILNGCARLFPAPVNDAAAVALLSRLEQNNSQLDQFKGIMRLRIESNRQDFSGRAAWAADAPSQLRVELLNMLGQPITSMAANGSELKIISRPDSKTYRLQQTRTSLEPLIEIPFGVDDLISLLAGRIPLPDHAAVLMSREGSAEESIELVNRWHATVARLYLDNSGKPRQLKVYNDQGDQAYRIDWIQWQTVDALILPRELELHGIDKQSAWMLIDRFWPQDQLPPSTFELPSPGSGF